MANIIQIKRRTSGSAGAPASLANGELAFNEVDNTLYYGFQSGVSAIAGYGYFTTVDTSQTVGGAKTFSSSVVLSSAVAETKATATSSVAVATTEFVQNVFSILDGGNFDENGGGGGGGNSVRTLSFVVYGGGSIGQWTDLNNWQENGVAATSLPDSNDITIIDNYNVIIDLDSGSWVEPAIIYATPLNGPGVIPSLSATSQTGQTLLNSVLSGDINVIILGNATLI